VVTWITGAPADGSTLGLLERATGEVAAQVQCDGRLMFVPQDEASAYAWLPLGGRRVRIFLQENLSYKATAERLVLHKNTVQYRVRKAEESLQRPVARDQLRIELALLAAQWLGPAVLRPAGGPS
jgi:PucR C-terminal helix-turn-helix domain